MPLINSEINLTVFGQQIALLLIQQVRNKTNTKLYVPVTLLTQSNAK